MNTKPQEQLKLIVDGQIMDIYPSGSSRHDHLLRKQLKGIRVAPVGPGDCIGKRIL